jgi:glycosyltransferase involved in cell wall biosynthesis
MEVHAMGPAILDYGYSPRWIPWLRAHTPEYDLVVVNGLWQFVGYGAWSALRGTETPYVVFPHGMLDPWFKNEYPLKHAKKWLYWAWAEYRVLRDAKAVIFTTEEERVLARTSFWLYNVKEAVVNYGTADPGPVTDSAKAAFSTKFPQLNGKRLLLYLGRIHRKKGCDLLIRAFADIIRSDDDSFRLVMAGPDATNWRPELVALSKKLGIADRISWPGPLEGELKWGAFGAAEAFVLCSHQENFGIAVAEALGCGVPVLISDKVNIWREIAEREAGFIAPDTLDGARQLLLRWADTSNIDRSRMRRNARATFVEYFEITRTAHAFLGVVEGFR